MNPNRLKVFVSGKERELESERLTAQAVINSLNLTFIGSEIRSSSNRAMEEVNPDEVRNSDVFIGIFGKLDSGPSIKEYETAKANLIPTLVFHKDLKNGEQRENNLEQFLHKIRDPKSGLVTADFQNINDLREKIKLSLLDLLVDSFFKAKQIEAENVSLKNKQINSEGIAIPNIAAKYKVPFLVAPGLADLATFLFPDNVTRGESVQTSATVHGTTKGAFLDLLIVDPDGRDYWYPEPQSWNSSLDIGMLVLNNENHSASWNISIPPDCETGLYSAFMGLYEDASELPLRDRRLLASKQKVFRVK